MPTVATRSATNSLAKDSRLFFGSLSGARCLVVSSTANSITIADASELTGTSQYSASAPGQVEVLTDAVATNQGKTTRITGITGAVLTVTDDLSTVLTAGDIIAVTPPPSVEVFLPPSGHTLNVSLENDFTRGATETFDTHNTPMAISVGGDVPFFQTANSEAYLRFLAFAIGTYKNPSSGVHKFRPIEANDGSFTELKDGTFLSSDGNAVIRQLYFGLMATRLNLEFPQRGVATGSLSVMGNGHAREIGGSGKAYTTGANNYIRANFVCDTGERFTFRGALVEFGGTFGAAITSAAETMVQDVSITIERGAIDDPILGDPYPVKAEESTFRVTASGTRILKDDTFFEMAIGGANAADPSTAAKTETRLLIVAALGSDATKTVTFDIPRGLLSRHSVQRAGQGRYKEPFEFQMLATLDSNGCISTTTPPLEITAVSSVVKVLSTTI